MDKEGSVTYCEIEDAFSFWVQMDIFSKDIILIPINHNNSHWTGAAINFRRKRIESYDSMNLDRRQVSKVC
jgi:sentrin-specific protease 1